MRQSLLICILFGTIISASFFSCGEAKPATSAQIQHGLTPESMAHDTLLLETAALAFEASVHAMSEGDHYAASLQMEESITSLADATASCKGELLLARGKMLDDLHDLKEKMQTGNLSDQEMMYQSFQQAMNLSRQIIYMRQ